MLQPNSNATGRTGNSSASNANSTNTQTIESFYNFLTEFSDGESFLYRDRLRANLLKKEWTLEVEMGHLIGWNEELAARCRTEPGEVVPLVSLSFSFIIEYATEPTRSAFGSSWEEQVDAA